MFAKNVGKTDRIIRGIAGILLFLLSFSLAGAWAWVLAVVGVVLMATAALGTCPPYALLGINTCKR